MSPYDQQVYDAGFKFIPQTQYLQNPFVIPQDTPTTGSGGGVNTIPINMGGGSGGGYSGGINDLMQNFTLDTRNQYFDRQPTPLVDDLYQSKLDRTFMGFPSYRQVDPIGPFTPYNQPMDMDDPAASIENIIASRNVPLELTRAGKIQQGIGNLKEGIGKAISGIGGFGPLSFVLSKMDRFSSLPAADQEFIKMNMGYTGPTVFGENTSGLSKDIYGINTRSLFGNYANYVDDFVDEYKDMTEEEFNKLSKSKQQKVTYYRQQQKILKDVREKKAKEEAAARAERDRIQASLDRGGYDSTSGRADRDRSSVTEASAAATSQVAGGGYTASDSNRDAARGRYMMGGLADMLEIYD